MKKTFLILLLASLVSSLLAQDKVNGIATDIPILMHRSTSNPGAFPLPWRRSIVMYEYVDKNISWSFGWGRGLETEFGWQEHYSSPEYLFTIRWKTPFRGALRNGTFIEFHNRTLNESNSNKLTIGYLFNKNQNLSFTPTISLGGRVAITPAIEAGWTPFSHLAVSLGTGYAFANNSQKLWESSLGLKLRIWKGIFHQWKISSTYESQTYYEESTDRNWTNCTISIKQYQYLGIMF
jgi:hypothetical protein